MDRRIASLFALGLFAVPLTVTRSQAQAQPDQPLTAERVRAAIDGGVKYLLTEQNPRTGAWNTYVRQRGGVTALCTLALLNSGVEPSNEQIKKALAFLRKVPPTQTYSVSLQTMAMCAASPREDLVQIQKNVNWLEQAQQEGGEWSYGIAKGGRGDNSNSQFAVLALHEAERVGATVKPETWERAAEYWRKCQQADGSWAYTKAGGSGTGSMTCAGIAATVICRGRVSNPNATVKDGFVQCCQPQEEEDRLENALSWLGKNFRVRSNPGSRAWNYYYLYGLERVGRLTARRLIGEHDWYRAGAEYLLSRQDQFNNNWVGQGHAEDRPHIATALALLFLSKGRRPVLMAKLEHGPDGDWNNHESDVAHLTARVEKLWGLDLTWQIFDPQAAEIDDLLQAPVLFLSGSESPELAGTEEKMRGYLDRGGFLFAEACCADGSDFEEGFRRYLSRVFPEKEYKLRRAGPEHPIWRVEQPVRPDSPYVGGLWTVEYGCRTCVVFSEIDLSCYWELYGQGRLRNVDEVVANRLADANAIGVNVVAYATNREPKGKEESFTGGGDLLELNTAGSRGTIQIAKLQHGGGCNDAPGALVNLLRTAAQGDLQLRVSTNEYPVRADDKSLKRFHMAFMHGRHDFKFTAAERAALYEYLTFGGTLFADSICASKDFATAFRREMKAVFPEGSLRRIPVTDPLFSTAPGGYDIQKVERRDPASQQAGQPLRTRKRPVEPELEGIQIDGRWAVIFSPYDISCALEQHESLECRGYTQQDAARIGLNVLMYTLNPDVGL